MMLCKDCVHYEVCKDYVESALDGLQYNDSQMNGDDCEFFKDRARFVELNIAKKIKHTPDIDKMREFHKLGLGKGMSERSIFWTCSNCKVWVSLAHKFCPNCGAKFEAEVEGA